MPKRTKNYDASLLEALRDTEEAAAYLAASLEDPDNPDAEKLFLMAVRNVAIAQGMTELARKTNLSRESLYKALSANGDPKHSTLKTVLRAVGLRFTVHSQKRKQVSPGMMVFARENLLSCDAIEWQTAKEEQHLTFRDSPRPGLPRRTKHEDEQSQTEWSSQEEAELGRLVLLAGGNGS